MKSKKAGPAVVVRRREAKDIAVFIDGTSLDRATRRIGKRVDIAALVRGVSAGSTPFLVRYYTLIPYEDDSRHRAFLESISRSGVSVLVKRLPPKSITRVVTVDLEIACDMVAFASGQSELFTAQESGVFSLSEPTSAPRQQQQQEVTENSDTSELRKRSIVGVCASRELAYAFSLAKELGCDTTSADFGGSSAGDVLKSAAKWMDLSTSQTIWMDD